MRGSTRLQGRLRVLHRLSSIFGSNPIVCELADMLKNNDGRVGGVSASSDVGDAGGSVGRVRRDSPLMRGGGKLLARVHKAGKNRTIFINLVTDF